MKCSNILACVTLSIVMLAAGCSAASGQGSATASPGYRGVVASGGNGSSTVFLLPVNAGRDAKSTAMTTAGKPACEACRAEADRYFRTGHMATNCAVCNAALSAAQQQH
jgi:hypothetical protein